MPASNEILASLYDPRRPQIIAVFPLVWIHKPYGDWRLLGTLEGSHV